MKEVFKKELKTSAKGGQARTQIKAGGDGLVETVRKMVEGGYSGPSWRSVTACPPDVRFETQGKDEKLLLLMRRHLITNVWWVGLVTVLLGVPLFWGEFPLISGVNPVVGLALAIFWYLGLAFFVLQNVLLWFYNVYIVTDERIIDVDFFGLLYKNINATQIRKIEDVNYSQVGMMSSLFNYGNVVVETAGEQRSDDRPAESSAFTFEAVSNPDQVVKVISELMEQEEKEEYEGRTR